FMLFLCSCSRSTGLSALELGGHRASCWKKYGRNPLKPLPEGACYITWCLPLSED
ncbi:hypothetical protein HAX54_003772, partial [Datura stramonium]|nr:hypothetical protein [Datura stramonium]